MIVAGLDVSLAATAVSRIHLDPIELRGEVEDLKVLRTKPLGTDLAARGERLDRIYSRVFDALGAADLVVIEAPAFASQTGQMHDRSGLWWGIVANLMKLGVRVVEVAPATLKKFTTGKGNASKSEMLAAVIRKFPDVVVVDDNAADALMLATLGAHAFRGVELVPVPARGLEAVESLRKANLGLVPGSLRSDVLAG